MCASTARPPIVVVHVMTAEVSVADSRVGPLMSFQGPALSLPAGG